MASTNYLYINTNGDAWVEKGEPGGKVRVTVERYEGVTDDVIAQLRENGWNFTPELRDHIADLPCVEF